MNTILVVEDEFDVRENLKDLLEAEGFNVLIAKDGSEGYKIAVENIPDVILSDIRMPNVDGLQLLKLLQKGKVTSRIPFLFLTAKVEMQDFREGMNLGADDYIIKPFKAQELLNAVSIRLLKKENYCESIKELKEQLITRVPHELRTPLVGIIGFSDILMNEGDNLPVNDIKNMAGVINTSGKRLHKRIEKLLQYSELVALGKDELIGKNNTEFEYELEPSSIIKISMNLFKEYNREDDAKISFSEGILKIEERFYQTILTEIIENAIKFSVKGTVINIHGQVEGEYFVTKIDDQGSGMDKNSINSIDSFKQFSKDIYRQEGLGIGLALVKKTVKMFNGYLNVEGEENKYTSVEFGIPLMKKEVSQ